MKISILGGGGFLGRKVAEALAANGRLDAREVTGLTLFDLHPPASLDAPFPVTCLGGDITALPPEAIPPETEVIFHLAAVVSAAAEADYDLGRRVNLRGTDAVIDACRALAKPPRVVFTSSVASFSGGQGAMLPDDARQMPRNSYGAQKAGVDKFAADMAVDFKEHNIATVSIWMGMLLTERSKRAIELHPETYGQLAEMAETPEFTGHLVTALYNDPELMTLTGQTLIGAELADRYGLTDAGGKKPLSHRPFLGDPRIPHAAIVR
jgi:nucleoside-diphosphate-sugar epimerase